MNRSRILLAVAGIAVVGAIGLYVAYDQFLRGDSVAPLALPGPSPTTATATATATATPTAAESMAATAAPAASAASAATAGDAASLVGTWAVTDGSVAGYRVREKLAGLPAESDAVGRTGGVSGEIVLAAPGGALSLESARIEVDLTTLTSDEARRDRRLRDSAIETNRFPTTTFTLTAPVAVPAGALTGATVEVVLTGDLGLHGVTRSVSIPAQARLADGRVEVVGSLTFPFADFAIEPPNIAGFVSVDDEGTLEFLLVLAKA